MALWGHLEERGEGDLLKGNDTRHCPPQPDLGLSSGLGTAAHTHTPLRWWGLCPVAPQALMLAGRLF